jgi:hypothetical protein
MKRSKLLLSGIAVLAIVGSSLAFKSAKFSDGGVFCSTTCSSLFQKAFRIDPSGSVTNPCTGSSQSTTPYYFDENNACQATVIGTTKFKATTTTGN